MNLTYEQNKRYSRQLVMKEIGESGQKKLLSSSVLVIGAGGLGSPALMYLASAGVGTIGIADADEVDVSNLQRQVIHNCADIGKAKVESAKEKINKLNPDVNVKTYKTYVNSENIAELISDYDFVLDCTDNFGSKFLINDYCVKAEKPFCHAGVVGFEGQLMTYIPHKSPCYRCVFEEEPKAGDIPLPKEIGVISAACGVTGSLQAMEAIKFLLSKGELLCGYMLIYNALNATFRKIKLPKQNPNCKACAKQA